MSNMDFRPDGEIIGDPQRNQQQFLLLQSKMPFEISQFEVHSGNQTAETAKTRSELHTEQRIPLFQDTLRKLTTGAPDSSEWPVDFTVRCRRLGAETKVHYSGKIQKCRKPGILKVVLKTAS